MRSFLQTKGVLRGSTPLAYLLAVRLHDVQLCDGGMQASAMIRISVDGREEITAAIGNGPVNALDTALRKALLVFYPQLGAVHLTDYKVRVFDTEKATGAMTRVMIETSDGSETWTTVGASADIIEASWLALVDSIEYKLSKE